MLTSSAKAVKEIISVCLRELARILETGPVVIDVVVLLNGLDDIALALEFEELLSKHNMLVIDWHCDVADIAFVLVKTSWVAVGTLVVRDGPLGCGHDAKIVISVGVDGVYKRIL